MAASRLYPTYPALGTMSLGEMKGAIMSSGHEHLMPVPIRQEEDVALQAAAAKSKGGKIPVLLARGQLCRHKKTGDHITIMAARVKRSVKGTSLHRVVNRKGKEWLCPETNLVPL